MTHLRRIHDYLCSNPGATAKEIAKALCCRRSSVERWLTVLVNESKAVAKITHEATTFYTRRKEAC